MAVKAVVIGVVVALLGVPPAHGQSDPEPTSSAPETTGRGRAESPPPAETQGEADGVSECDDLYAQGEWDESEFIELLDCLFDLSELVERGRQL